MNKLKKTRQGASKTDAAPLPEESAARKPIEADFEDYENYMAEKKYEDLISHMEMYPQIEAFIFEYFYLHLKPLVGQVFIAGSDDPGCLPADTLRR